MMSGPNIRIQYLWGVLVTLLFATATQANTLTKLRAVEGENGAQLILSFTHPPAYTIMPHLERKLVIIHLSKTDAQPEYVLPRFTGPVLQDIELYLASGSSPTDGTASDLRIEVLLKSSAVVVSHRALDKPDGLILNIRQTPPTSKTEKSTQRHNTAKAAQGIKSVNAHPQPPASINVTAPPSADPSPLAGSSAVPKAAVAEAAQDHQLPVSIAPPSTGEEPSPSLSEAGHPAPPGSPAPPSLPATTELRGIAGHGSSAAALAMLDLYFHRPATFTANPALLWSVAAAYVDLGLYEQGDVLYRQISDHMDNPALQAAAVLKRGKVALLQGELPNAEGLLRAFVNGSPPGLLLAEAHEALGDTFMAQEKFAEAVEVYSVALRHTPEAHKPPPLLSKLGHAERKAGHWQNAAAAFRQAIEQLSLDSTGGRGAHSVALPPAFAEDLFQQLGDSLYKSQQYPQAVVAYRRVLEQTPTVWQTGWSLYHLGRSHEALGQHEAAALTYQDLTRQGDAVWSEVGQQALTTLRWRAR
jgi:TolA-binding protein